VTAIRGLENPAHEALGGQPKSYGAHDGRQLCCRAGGNSILNGSEQECGSGKYDAADDTQFQRLKPGNEAGAPR